MTARGVRGVALLAAAAALVCASGCSGSATAGGLPSVEKPNLNVAVVPALDSAGFFVALYQGLFTKAGLHVTFTPGRDSDGSGFGDAPFEEPSLGGGAGQVERAPEGGPGLVPAAEPPQ